MIFLIDGYNLVRRVESLHEGYDPPTDIEICRRLSRYLSIIKERGQIIFDGIGPPEKNSFYNLKNLKVIFSGSAKEADTVIEEKIEQSTDPKRLVIVSSDNRLVRAARSRKSKSVKADEFWFEVEKFLERRKKRIREPIQKFKGLTESETKQWLKIFGLDNDDE